MRLDCQLVLWSLGYPEFHQQSKAGGDCVLVAYEFSFTSLTPQCRSHMMMQHITAESKAHAVLLL